MKKIFLAAAALAVAGMLNPAAGTAAAIDGVYVGTLNASLYDVNTAKAQKRKFPAVFMVANGGAAFVISDGSENYLYEGGSLSGTYHAVATANLSNESGLITAHAGKNATSIKGSVHIGAYKSSTSGNVLEGTFSMKRSNQVP